MAKRPNSLYLRPLQLYSTRGWVWREEQGWVFAEMTPDERAEFRSYERYGESGITIARMKVRIPCDLPVHHFKPRLNELEEFPNWFALCTTPQAHPLLLSRFQLCQTETGDYETGLWPDQFNLCQEAGCNLHIRYAYGWSEWGVPAEWKAPLPPLQFKKRAIKERIFIYAFVNELTQEVYVGQTDNLKRRLVEHLKDTRNSKKVALLQSLRTQGREPQPITLEEVASERATEREQFWTFYYKGPGYKIVNRDLWLIHPSE